MHPPFFSVSLPHCGQALTLRLALHSRLLTTTGAAAVGTMARDWSSLASELRGIATAAAAAASSADSRAWRLSSQVMPSCHGARQSKQNSVPHPSRSHLSTQRV